MGNLNFNALIYEASLKEEKPENEYVIKEASNKVKAAIEVNILGNKSLYPFELLEVGKCFDVPFSEVNERAFRVLCSLNGKRTGKKFKCIKLKESGVFEVSRVA